MLSLDKVVAGAKVRGLAGAVPVEVVRTEWIGADALNVVYRGADGPAEVLLFRDAEPRLELVQASRAFSFDGDGEAFRIASEAQRIRLAHLFDPYLAVHSSRIEPLPHQITAVYGEMLPRQPLRFLLADDPGAGKTIMAGLLIKELIIRGDLERCLIIAPGNLVEQWQDELKDKFDLTFDIVSREQIETSVTGNPFIERSRLIMRLDMAARSETLQAKLQAAPDWDLVVCDEAHRMAASLFGTEVKYTKRYKLGQLAGGRARHFMLMSATPHNGNDADFELFMGLLDADRFEGRPREGVRKVDVSDLMRRLTKEELRKFDGAPLFPERKAYTIQYQLSDLEAQLYAAVTQYVRNEMRNLNNLGDDKRRNNVGFALQILQRRLASSPAAIFHSLRRRRNDWKHGSPRSALLRVAAGCKNRTSSLRSSTMRRTVISTKRAVPNWKRPSRRSRIAPRPHKRSPSWKPSWWFSVIWKSSLIGCAGPVRMPNGASSAKFSISRR
jgi:hypothetical protein